MGDVVKKITTEDVVRLLSGFDGFDFKTRAQSADFKKGSRTEIITDDVEVEVASMIEKSRLKIKNQLEKYEETIKDFIDSQSIITSEYLGNYTGPLYGWEYWVPETKTWRMTATEGAACKISGVVRRAWLWCDNGKPIRELDAKEIVEYCP